MNAIGRLDMAPPLMLDISRLLSVAGEGVPTGIDRVELAWAEHLLAHAPARTSFAALRPLGGIALLPDQAAARFIASLSRRWSAGDASSDGLRAMRRQLLRHLMLPGIGGRRGAAHGDSGRPVYLLLSHHHLTKPAAIAGFLRRHGAAFLPMVHDLIPSDYPEYARPKEAARHRRRIATVAALADGALVPSEAVRGALLAHLGRDGRPPQPVQVAPHGPHRHPAPDPARARQPRQQSSGRPYFVCVGTIEGRKNHLLLLTLWRRLVERHGAAAPRLVLIGRRGWENENVVDLIERCPALQGVLDEHNCLPDDRMTALVAGARALLLPSFAEGYGLPLVEAMALGVPVICSDLPVFREVGGGVPTYLDPLDGLGWMAAIEEFTGAGSQRRDRQIAALAGRVQPSWQHNIAAALRFVESVAASGQSVRP